MRRELRENAQFVLDFLRFRKLQGKSGARFSLEWKERHACLRDNTTETGFDRHYTYHLAWAARVLAGIGPAEHVDISSSLFFSTMVSAFLPVSYYDFRPADLQLPGLSSQAADLLRLPFGDASVRSLSCMHVVEHVGLGRYGDPLDPEGDLKAISELKRVLAVGGSLLFVVPIGRPKIAFNAHRIYSYDQIVQYFSDFELRQFALVPDHPEDGGLVVGAGKEMADAQQYGCGCFWLVRSSP